MSNVCDPIEGNLACKSKVNRNLLLVGALVLAAVAVCFAFRQHVSLGMLAGQEAWLKSLRQGNPLLVFTVAFAAYVIASSLPGIAGKSFLYGWLFGFWPALALVSFASAAAATLMFLLGRHLLRDAVQSRFGHHLQRFNQVLKREGAYYLFTLRVMPVAPFSLINLAMGTTRMRVRTFWAVSQLGMLPANCLCVYAGSKLPGLGDIAQRGFTSLLTPQLIVAFTLLALFPFAVRATMTRLSPAAS